MKKRRVDIKVGEVKSFYKIGDSTQRSKTKDGR